ncbi:MAG: hypothetical protein K8W52_26550 [Deltaproteobacteria bacterium]|nr:hypothetical protein [Deltaproteobacteria bacterium]
MGRAGLALVAAFALGACRGAAADGRSLTLAVPAQWTPLPAVAHAAQAAAGTAARAQAWGDPAAGCYLIAVAVDGKVDDDPKDAAAALAEGVGVSLTGDPANGVAAIDGPIHAHGLTGRVRGFVTPRPSGALVSTAVACLGNDRDPSGCAKACDGVWAALTAAPEVVAAGGTR